VIGASNARLDGFVITRGNAGSGNGAGMFNEMVSGLQVMNSVFSSNVAIGDGGGMHNDNAEVEIGNCIFRNNSAYHGGGIENYSNCQLVITDTIFDGNNAAAGGAMHNGGGPADGYIGGHVVNLYNCLVVNNTGSVNGGGVTYVNSTGTIVNSTITGNSTGGQGGGNYNHAATPFIINSIVYENSPNQVFNIIDGGAVVSYSDVQGGYAGTNIDLDPSFMDTTNGDYSLRSDSPCIDSGDNSSVTSSVDLAGNPRITDGDGDTTATVDMGSFEYMPPNPVAYYPFNGNANDESGNGFDGTVSGATLVADRFGSPASAFSFDGVDDYIDVGSSNVFNFTNNLTISAWIKIRDISEANPIFSRADVDQWVQTLGYYFFIAEDYWGPGPGRLVFSFGNPTWAWGRYYADPPVPIGSWVHVAVTFNGSPTFFINGEQVTRTHEYGSPGPINGITDISSYIGVTSHLNNPIYWPDFKSMRGCIDDLRIFNRVLSSTEIQYLYLE
jgi:hypothetical protein